MSDNSREPIVEQTEAYAQQEPEAGPDRDSIDLALRFLVGLLAIGGEEAARRLQEVQNKLDADPSLWNPAGPAGQKGLRRRAWHLGIGMARRHQKRLRRRIRSSYDRSLRVLGRVSSAPERWGAGFMTRPVRQPIQKRVLKWRQQAAIIEKEGELEEQMGRALATETLAALILEIMDEIAANPQLLEFVQDLLSEQGKGMASVVMDNTRSVTLTADDTAEALLRRVLRRKPRRELPPSPVEGQRQTMYEPTIRVDEGAPDAD